MIASFADDVAEGIFHGNHSHAVRENFPLPLMKVAERKLDLLNTINDLDVLLALPEHKNSRAGRDRHGKISIPIDERWCIQFRWNNNSVEDVEILIA
jgi:proteic killer suppression protein